MQVQKANIGRYLWRIYSGYPVPYHGYKPVKINEKPVACVACLQEGRKSYILALKIVDPGRTLVTALFLF